MISYNDPVAGGHYDASYFAWQSESGHFGGWANVDLYKGTIRSTDKVLDFGCGGGFLMANLECGNRFGIEPNPTAREKARSNGVTVFFNPAQAISAPGEGTLDVIISNNALEHALGPWRELKALLLLLKPGGAA